MDTKQEDIKRFMQNLAKEVDGAALYSVLAEKETRPEMKTVYQRLSESEDRHAAFWRKKLTEAGVTIPDIKPGWRTT